MKRRAYALWITLLSFWILPSTSLFASETGSSASAVRTSDLTMRISVGGKVLVANLEDNPTSRAFLKRLPLTLPMLNLYGRELVYRLPDPLPTGDLRSDNYIVGDIVYWPPRRSFVILYKQNGEKFSRQQIGHITADLSFLDGAGDLDAKFE